MKLNITVIPNAKSPEIIKIDENDYKIKVDASASEGKANVRLIELLSEYFNVSKSSVRILKGFKNRNKIVSIDNL
jgi:uncharacterized protein (TIGR00251 family)